MGMGVHKPQCDLHIRAMHRLAAASAKRNGNKGELLSSCSDCGNQSSYLLLHSEPPFSKKSRLFLITAFHWINESPQ